MFQGTGSDVGKSLIVAGLARAFANQGLRVRPFKPQNMSNNAAVTVDGGEIGRAQALQARAARTDPTSDMNPVLLKPQTDVGAQVVVRGKVRGNATARQYIDLKPKLLPEVLSSFARLSAQADIVLVEGAGSVAEINLRAADIANMGFAEAADVPVVLVADIDRGGVIAALVGSHVLLPATERARIKGFIVNKFRGDAALFADGMAEISRRTQWPALGLAPYWPGAHRLPAEDAVVLERGPRRRAGGAIRIAVPRLSRIANFDDFDPLIAEPEVDLQFIEPGAALPGDIDLVILPGSKATLADLRFLRRQGWDIDISAHVRRGGHVLGVCAGFQMLGRSVEDAEGLEGAPGREAGLGLLDLETAIAGAKSLSDVSGRDVVSGQAVAGFEMHCGTTTGPALERPMLRLGGERPEGAVDAEGRVMGCYVHGLFAEDGFRQAFLRRLGGGASSGLNYAADVDAALDELALHLDAHLNLARILEIAGGR
jgi:adenosylcobyric acid synthase